MTIKDILTITGGSTKVVIFSADKEQRYIRLWYGIVDDIHFPYVPYGYYDIEHITIINEEDILQLHFEYPELSKDHIDMINEEAVGYPYPTDWIEKLFIKYRDWKYVRELLVTKSKDEIYDEIRIIPDEEFVDETPIYNWEEAVGFIHDNCNLSEDMIIEVLELEEEYMKTIGVITEEEEPNLWVIDGMQRTEGKIDLDNPSQRNPVQWSTVDDLQRMSKTMEESKNGNKSKFPRENCK